MRHRSATIVRHAEAPIEQVWDLLARTEAWPDWAPIRQARLERPSMRVGGEGVGAIRSLRTPLGTTREEVVTFDAPHHLGYIMLSGMPVEDYRANVRLEADGGGTRITWTASLRASGFWARGVELIIRRFSRRLAVRAEELTLTGS